MAKISSLTTITDPSSVENTHSMIINNGTDNLFQLPVSVLKSVLIINSLKSDSTDVALSAAMGKLLQDELADVKGIGKFLSLWDCATGKPITTPVTLPYTYNAGDYFIVSNIPESGNVYIPSGSSYTGEASTTVATETVKVSDTYFYDGSSWSLLKSSSIKNIKVNGINGELDDNGYAVVDVDRLIADQSGKVYASVDESGTIVLKPLALEADLSNKSNSSALATPFTDNITCLVGKYYSYEGNVYKCITQHTGSWDANDFSLELLTNPDATLSIDDSTGELVILDASNNVIWSGTNLSRYKSIISSSTSISTDSNSVISIDDSNSSTTTYNISLPNPLANKINDFIIDVHAGGSGDVALSLNNLDTTYKLLVKTGTDLNTSLTISSGSYARFSITQSSLTISNLPVYILNRIDLELYSSI